MHRVIALSPRLAVSTKTIPYSTAFKVARPCISSPRPGYAPNRIKTPTIVAMASSSSPSSQQQNQPSVAVVTTQGCPYCRQAKADLTAAGIPYTEILITDQLDVLNEIKKTTGQATVPQVNRKLTR